MGVGAGAAMIGGIMIGKALADRRQEKEYQRYRQRQHKLPYEQIYYEEVDNGPLPTDYDEEEPYDEASYPNRQRPQHHHPVGPKQQKIPRDKRNKG
uniref:Uncharacterized protein n=1 Tax=Acrobeloides nanus TaxID=290746 RepID=A0A914DK24_9BILA